MAKTILITGAASGIGEAAVRFFKKKGWKIVGVDINLERLENIKEECFLTYQCDVSSSKQVRGVFEELEKRNFKLDALFNCAGILRMGLFEKLSLEKQLKEIDVNLKGIVNCTYLFSPLMEKGATVVNMSSLSALYGTPELAVYSATKSAVKTLTEALNIEFEKKGIYVCDIIVDYVKTPMILDADYKAVSVKRLGVTVSPHSVAKKVYKSVLKGKGAVHRYVGVKAHTLNILSKLFPFASRFMAKILAF